LNVQPCICKALIVFTTHIWTQGPWQSNPRRCSLKNEKSNLPITLNVDDFMFKTLGWAKSQCP
jgi:hypothetical protein